MGSAGASRHGFVEHTGELSIRVEAPTVAALFVEAARALAEVMGGGCDPGGAGESGEAGQAGQVGQVGQAGKTVQTLETMEAGEAGQAGEAGEAEEVAIDAPDRDALLVDWLNELIWRAEVRGRLYEDVTIDAMSDTSLHAVIRGRAVADLRSEVKAATFHGLRIAPRSDGGVAAIVVLDV